MSDVLLSEDKYRVECLKNGNWLYEGERRTLEDAKKRKRLCQELDERNGEAYEYRIVKITTTEVVYGND